MLACADPCALQRVYLLLSRCTHVHIAPTIQVAEACKLVENCQRDVNIALMNEISTALRQSGISTSAVLEAAATKWNFSPFTPGFVGGHCIPVDPHYMMALNSLHDFPLLRAARRTNNTMPARVASFISEAISVGGSHLLILGQTMKADVPDTRNALSGRFVEEMERLGHQCTVSDALVGPCTPCQQCFHGVILLVAHQEYRTWSAAHVQSLLADSAGLVADLAGAWRGLSFEETVRYWHL